MKLNETKFEVIKVMITTTSIPVAIYWQYT